jgi:tetratricopeptide (TPR) repeat protein
MNGTNKRSEMLEMLITIGLSLSIAIGIGDTIALAGLAKRLIGRIGEKDAFGILKKALDKTIKEAEDAEAKDILKSLKDDKNLLREFHERLDVSEETRGSLVSQYFNGRDNVLENLAKNYYELFCKAAIKKDGAFKEFVVTGLIGLKTQGIITNEAVKNVERYLEEITEDLKRIKEAESRQFSITSDLNEVRSEISEGKPKIGYVERNEIEEVKEALKTTNKLIVVGKPGAGKTRFVLRILEDFDCDMFVVIKNFFREDGINTLDVELQKLNSFVLIWDDVHTAKAELVKSAINQIEQLARGNRKKFLFVGTSRASDKYYGFEPEEKNILLKDFRNVELVEECSAYFGVSAEVGVTKKFLEVGDGTPFYVISLFATLEEQGKKELTLEDLRTLPEDSFDIWCKHLEFLDGEGELSTSEKYVLRSIALAMHAVRRIDFETLGEFYEHVFRGRSYFEDDLNEVINKFFIGKEGEFYFIHAVQVWAVESEYPLKGRHIQKLRGVLAPLKRDKSAILLWGFAIWLYESKRYEESLEFWDAFMKKEPNRDGAYNNRGVVYAELNQYKRAIEDYDEAVKLNPEYAEAYNNRGVAYAGLNRHERAIEDYDEAVKLNPKDAKAYYNRGNSYTGLNQYKRAIWDYEEAVKLNTEYAEAYANRGMVYSLIAKYEKSTRDLKRGGVLFLESGRTEDAAKSFNLCFNLRDKIESDDVIYCGLAIYIVTLDADVIIEIREMQAEDRVLERIVALTLKKLNGEDVSDEMEEMGKMNEQEDAKALLDLLKMF